MKPDGKLRSTRGRCYTVVIVHNVLTYDGHDDSALLCWTPQRYGVVDDVDDGDEVPDLDDDAGHADDEERGVPQDPQVHEALEQLAGARGNASSTQWAPSG